MRLFAASTVLLAAALLAPVSAFAADAQLVAQVEKMLSDDEKSILAALLTHPDLSAQFDADAALALKDKQNLHPFLGVWRAKFEAYAETDSHHATPDLNGQYSRYTDLMSADMFAFLERSLPLMDVDKRNDVIGYLKAVDEDLKQNGHLGDGMFDFTKKMVAGIMEEYRKHLTAYAASPLAQDAKRDVASNSAALADLRKSDDEARQAAAKPARKPIPKPETDAAADAPAVDPSAARKKPGSIPPSATAPAGSPTTDSAGTGAREQLDRAANAGFDSGRVVDGGGASRQTDAVVVPSGSGSAHPALPPSAPSSQSSLTASGPVVPSPSGVSRADSLLGMQTKPANPPALRKLKIAGGILGALIGGLIGFFVGGPVGAIVGAVAGAGVGLMAGKLAAKKLLR
jgi:hypothetical protein